MFARERTEARERFLAHQRPIRIRTEAVLDEDLHAARATLHGAFDQRFGRVLGLVRARGQRMVLRVGWLVNVVRECLVAHGLRQHRRRIAVEHRGGAAVKQVGPHRLALESLEPVGERQDIENLRYTEIQIAARLLTEIRVTQRDELGLIAQRRNARRRR